MVTGQAKMDATTRSAITSESSSAKSEAEIIGHIQKAFAEKNSALLLLERRTHEQGQALDNAQSEAATLMAELHRTQELLELSKNQISALNEQATRTTLRIGNLRKLLPEHWEMEISSIKTVRKNSSETIQWVLKNVYIDDFFVPHLEFDTQLTRGALGLTIRCADANIDGANWLVSSYASRDGLVRIFPEAGSAVEGRNLEISEIGTTDWSRIKKLVEHLAQYLALPQQANAKLKKIDKSALSVALITLSKTLNEWPWVCRFDQIKLKDTLQTSEYHRLGISLGNFSVGNYSWPKLEYNLATVDHTEGFGQNPRLEFPEASKDVLKQWYAESSDGRGPRLELRFAKPNAFDWKVWGKLVNDDQLLIAALISSLPTQIASMERQNAHIKGLAKWKTLSQTVKTIFSDQLKGTTKS